MEDLTKKVHYSINVKGKVQGVFYRASTKEIADQLDIKGWVRNERDGSVLIEAEGTESQINSFLDWCRQGPQYARVEKITWKEKPLEGFHQFSIER